MGDQKEYPKHIRAYLMYEKVIERVTPVWNAMGRLERREIARDLFAQAQLHPCGLVAVSDIVRRRRLTQFRFSLTIGQQEFESSTPLMQAARPYLALYHSRIGGGFDSRWFADNYAKANAF